MSLDVINDPLVRRDIPFYRPGAGAKPLFSCFDNKVTVAHLHSDVAYTGAVSCVPGRSIFDKAEAFFRLWPAVYARFPRYVRYIHPLEYAILLEHPLGSASGCTVDEFGVVYTSVMHPFTLAETLVHEMAHMELFTMDINYESADRVILNDPSEEYYSPVRGVARPMTAVFHAQYSFIHVLHLDLLMLQEETADPLFGEFVRMTADTLCKMKEGHDIITRDIRTDVPGERFVNNFLQWSANTIDRAAKLLQYYGWNETT